MPRAVELVRAELLLNAAVVALLADRIYPVIAPQGTLTPYVVLSVVSTVPFNSFDSTTRLSSVRLQVDSYATTYRKSADVAEAVDAVISALSRPDLQAYLDASQDLYEDATALHRVSADYIVML